MIILDEIWTGQTRAKIENHLNPLEEISKIIFELTNRVK